MPLSQPLSDISVPQCTLLAAHCQAELSQLDLAS